MTLKDQMESIYRGLEVDEIPWNIPEPPPVLVELIESGRIQPCDAVDLGCGVGHHALWLAQQGFRMTGIDLSSSAVELASAEAEKRGVSGRFVVRDMTEPVEGLDDSFDFAYDWKVLHHVFPENRARWAKNVHRMLRPGGRYVSICFSEEEPTGFEGAGKYRDTPLGTTLYLSSEEEIMDVFESLFVIDELNTIVVSGKSQPHTAVKALMTRKHA